MIEKTHYLIETDLMMDHLTARKSVVSDLTGVMCKGMCFTTVINASELFSECKTGPDQSAVKDLLSAMKVLGIHSRYSLSIMDFNTGLEDVRDKIIAVVAKLNKLKIVSYMPEKYISAGITALKPNEIRG